MLGETSPEGQRTAGVSATRSEFHAAVGREDLEARWAGMSPSVAS